MRKIGVAGQQVAHKPTHLAQSDALHRVVHRTVKIVPLVQRFGHSHAGYAGKRHRPAACFNCQFERLPVGFDRLAKQALRFLNVTQCSCGSQRQFCLAGCPAEHDSLGQGTAGGRRVVVAPVRNSQADGDNTAQEQLLLRQLLQRLVRELDRAGYIPSDTGDVGTDCGCFALHTLNANVR